MGNTVVLPRQGSIQGPRLRMSPSALPELWARLEIRPELVEEHVWWTKKIDSDYNMAPSRFLRYLRSGKLSVAYYNLQNKIFGDFVTRYMFEELNRFAIFSNILADFDSTVEEFGLGAGHTLRWLALAHKLGFRVKAYDWVLNSLMTCAEVLEDIFTELMIKDISAPDLLHLREIEDVLDEQIKTKTKRILRLYSRVLHHAAKDRLYNIMYKTGKTADPNGVTTIITPLPNKKLNQPVRLKYRSGHPWLIERFLVPYSQGFGQKCVVLRMEDIEFFRWQTITAFTIGPEYLRSQYELL